MKKDFYYPQFTIKKKTKKPLDRTHDNSNGSFKISIQQHQNFVHLTLEHLQRCCLRFSVSPSYALEVVACCQVVAAG